MSNNEEDNILLEFNNILSSPQGVNDPLMNLGDFKHPNVDDEYGRTEPTAIELSGFENNALESDPCDTEIPTPVIQNVIASVHLDAALDLRKIAVSARNAEFNPRKANAVIIRLRNPKCTGLIFRTGRMIITGAKNLPDSKLGGKRMAKLCQKVGHPNVRFCGYKVENIIASADAGFPVRLEGIARDHHEFCNYEPELSPGLVYRYNPADDHRAVLLIFVSGKVIVTACKTFDHVCKTFEAIFPLLWQYRK
eukprot:GHVO01069126.1.p1 GENE.GHVO01069126.1~~GHVO01069126.1.p1  ORF type:complete len:251 (+),score=24.87 GHVO01069126.1:22-774(+)